MQKLRFVLILISAFLFYTPLAQATDDPSSTAISDGGDAKRGKTIYNRCRACHLLTEEERPRQGPTLFQIFGRQAGTVKGSMRTSKALSEAGFVWTEEKLDEWLTSPRTFLPGNTMNFLGLKKEKDRKDLMAFLRQATVDPETAP